MTNRNIFSLILKVLGIYSIYKVVIQIPSFVSIITIGFYNNQAFSNNIVYIINYAFLLIVSLIILKFSDTISKIFFKEEKLIQLDKENEIFIFSVSLKIVGIITIIKGLSELSKVTGSLFYVLFSQVRFERNRFGGLYGLDIVFSSIVLIVIGIFLIFKNKQIIQLINKEQK